MQRPNIAMAVENFKDRGYAQLGGLILNRRNVKNEEEKVAELAEDIHSKVIGTLSRSELVTDAEEQQKTVMEAYPSSADGRRIPGTCKTDQEAVWNLMRR